MCGIAGSVNFKLPYPLIREQLMHRGPDEQSGIQLDQVDLYHLRLSILDIGGGKQPMQLDGRYTIIFNGEIYNHQEIRQALGIRGNTHSDTETLLLLYQRFGKAMLQYLEGMFAFAIYDQQNRQLFIARDRAGKKPLYYYHHAKQLVFASELNCLKSLLPLQMNRANIYRYLRLGSFYRNQTPYEHVHELPAGSCLTIQCEPLDLQLESWWSIDPFYRQSNDDDFATALETVDKLLHQGVKRRIESSDLEVGCFLSGGIDSGLITAIASQYHRQIQTFTVSFSGEYNEAPLAKQVAEKYHTRHTEIPIAFDHLQQDLETILGNYGEPFFDSSAIPSYYVSQEARKHLTVILNGDGADELFGGYRRYVPFAQHDFFQQHGLRTAGARLLQAILPPGNSKKSTYNYLYRLITLANKSGMPLYLSATVDILEDLESYLIDPPSGYLAQMEEEAQGVLQSSMSGLKKLMNLDFNISLCNQLLVKMDIASMANSLEGRSPFLCKELLEYAPGMNDAFKIKGTTTKVLLRELAKQYLPPELVNQPKRGFEIPLKNWVEVELKDIIFDYVGSSQAISRSFLQPSFIDKLLQHNINISAEKRAKILWTLLSLEIWYQRHLRPIT